MLYSPSIVFFLFVQGCLSDNLPNRALQGGATISDMPIFDETPQGGGGNSGGSGGNGGGGGENGGGGNSGGGNGGGGGGNRGDGNGGGGDGGNNGGGGGNSGVGGNDQEAFQDQIKDAVMDKFKKAPKEKKTMFGTKNGYDVGGSDPLCWISSWSADNMSAIAEYQNRIENLNEQMFELADQAELMPSCFRGINMTLSPVNWMNDMKVIMGSPYTVEVDFRVDLVELFPDLFSELSPDITIPAVLPPQEIYFRLHLCDAVKQGFCNPIRDTRMVDQNLTREEADLPDGDEPQEPFSDDADKWKYTEGTILQGLTEEETGMQIFFGRWCKWMLRQEEEGATSFRSQVNITIQLPVSDEAGLKAYFFLGQAVVGRQQQSLQGTYTRLDVSQTMPNKVVYVKPPPEILEVTTKAKVILSVASGLTGIFALFCLVAILRNQNHSAMRLAQGSFLAAMAAACLVQIVSSFSYLPSRDVFCRMRGPLIQIPITFVAAILVGRVWRIYSTLNNVNSLGKMGSNSKSSLELVFVGFLDVLSRVLFPVLRLCNSQVNHKISKRRSIRRTVTTEETVSVILMLTLPQIGLQLYGALRNDAGLETELNQIGNLGRVVCGNDGNWVERAGLGLSCLVNVMAVLMAWCSRDLPSAFNEKDQIFNASTIGAIITALSLALGEVIDQPTTSPDAVVFLQVCVSIGVALAVLVLIILPKVRRVFSGEKVVVSNMLGSKFAGRSDSLTTSETDASARYSTPEVSRRDSAQAFPSMRVKWSESDAIPKHIENQIFDLQTILRSVTNKCGDGRTVSKSEWLKVQTDVGKLKADLDKVEVVESSPV